MTSGLGNAADAPLWTLQSKAPVGWFDRVLFDMHASADAPWLFIAAGKTPGTQVRDGSVVFVDRVAQRNLRFSSAGLGENEIGPLRWEVLEPSRRWHLQLDANPSGVEFDVEWRSRGRVWSETSDAAQGGPRDETTPTASWADQPGMYTGWLSVDGRRQVVDGWLGQRSRVRGCANPLTEEGLRLWGHGQFDDWTLSFATSQLHTGAPMRVFGAVQPLNGPREPDPLVSVEHALTFGHEADCRSGRLALTTASGRRLLVGVDPGRLRGGHMAGGGYGGWFGVPRGEVVEADRWDLDGGAAALDPYVGRLCRYVSHGEITGTGSGIFGVARPRAYRYEPTLRRR